MSKKLFIVLVIIVLGAAFSAVSAGEINARDKSDNIKNDIVEMINGIGGELSELGIPSSTEPGQTGGDSVVSCVDVNVALPDTVFWENPFGGGLAEGHIELANCGDMTAEIQIGISIAVNISYLIDTTFILPPFSDCGILLMDLGCLLFMPLSQPDTLYYLGNYGQFTAGDSVCVSGTLTYDCDSICPSAAGCIGGNSIYAWQNEGWPYEECGTLVQGVDCIVFVALYDTIYLATDSIGQFVAGDTVCISGVLEWGCDLGCSGVSGCLFVSNISYRNEYYHNFEMIIKLDEGFSIEPILTQYQGIPLDSIIPGNKYLVAFPQNQLVEFMADSIWSMPGVLFAQPNYAVGFPETFHVSQTFPDDSQPILNWGVTPLAYFSESGGYTIDSDSANIYSGGENVVVAVIDNGVDLTHPLLINSFTGNGYDFVDGDGDPSEEEGNLLGHGTFICGVIRRIAPECKFLPIRAFDANGFGNSFTLAYAIQYAIDQSVDAINMSFGNYASNPVIQEAVDDAVNAGICLIAAAGNAGTNIPSYPAAYPGVIAVSALDSMEYRAAFSNYGDYVDVCAPGVNIYSSLAGAYEWGNWSGTSFAAPMVSGVCALILSEENELGPYEMESLIRQTAENNLLWGSFTPPSSYYGYGRVDALEPVVDASRGDVDNSQDKNIMDITYLINLLYKGGPLPKPTPEVGDTDCSANINLFDIVLLIKYLYLDGPRPSCLAE